MKLGTIVAKNIKALRLENGLSQKDLADKTGLTIRYIDLSEIYHFKEAMYGLYRIKGYNQASRAFTKLTDRMALSKIPEVKTLRRTFMKWRNEILNYFKTGITNARTEGFNNVAKLVQKRAYGVKSFEMYRLRYPDQWIEVR